MIREAGEQDWPRIYPFFAAIVAAGRTYAFPENLSLEEARPWWMERPPGRTVVAVDGDTVLGSAKMGPNRPGRGAHVATASFMVDPNSARRGTGRALGEHVLDWPAPPATTASSSTRWWRPTWPLSRSGKRWASRSSPPSPRPSTTRSTGSSACT